MKEFITPANVKEIQLRLEELLVRAWKLSRPLFPQMILKFKVTPREQYYSTTGKVFWETPVWRGDSFALATFLHEGFHWCIYPVDIFRNIKDLFTARRLLADEVGYKPIIREVSLWRREEDWSSFPYKIEEFQLALNILGDYLVNLHIHDYYPLVWNDLWNFLYKEGSLYLRGKSVKRDTTFSIYLTAYADLIPSLERYRLKTSAAKKSTEMLAQIIRECRAKKISHAFAAKEIVKILHKWMLEDMKEANESRSLQCPTCENDNWQVVAYQDKDGKWITL